MLLEARPEPIRVDPERTALLVIDMQNDFGARGGMFDRAGIDISEIQNVVAPTAKAMAAARKARIPIIYLKMGFRADLSDAGPRESPTRIKHQRMHFGDAVSAPDGSPSRILVRDTWNTDILETLAPQPGDVIVWKNRYSGFYNTELDSVLKSLNARYLIVTGCTTSVCVESTVRDAAFRDYAPILLEDCSAEPVGYRPRSNHEASLLIIERLFGWVSNSDHFVQALEAQPAAVAVRA